MILQNTLTSESYLHKRVFKIDPVASFLYCFNECFLKTDQIIAFLFEFPNSYYPACGSIKLKKIIIIKKDKNTS